METTRTIEELSKREARVYVLLENDDIVRAFTEQAEKEGFHYQDGVAISERKCSDVMALNPDQTINFVGLIGHMLFDSDQKMFGDQILLRVDYEKYMAGAPESEYILEGTVHYSGATFC